jgi:hypothetical protein
VQALVLIMLGLLVVTAARIEGSMGRAVTRSDAREAHMSTLTFSKTLDDGTVVTLTVTQKQGETTEQFMARARAEWAAFCAEFGG